MAGYRVKETFHLDRASADKAQKERGVFGYSETHAKGVSPCKVIHPHTGKVVDGWRSVTKTHYG